MNSIGRPTPSLACKSLLELVRVLMGLLQGARWRWGWCRRLARWGLGGLAGQAAGLGRLRQRCRCRKGQTRLYREAKNGRKRGTGLGRGLGLHCAGLGLGGRAGLEADWAGGLDGAKVAILLRVLLREQVESFSFSFGAWASLDWSWAWWYGWAKKGTGTWGRWWGRRRGGWRWYGVGLEAHRLKLGGGL